MLAGIFVYSKKIFNFIFSIVHNTSRKIIICKNCISLFVNYSTLFVQYIIVIKQVFTNFKVAVFYLLLGLFNTLVQPWVINRFTRFHTNSSHHDFHSFATEKTHQIIIHRDVELRTARVTLTTRTTTQLIINTTAFMTFCTNYI